MSKNIKTTALVLVLLLAFLCGFGMGKNRGFNLNYNINPTGTTAASEVKPVDATAESGSAASSADESKTDTVKTPVIKRAPKKAPKTPQDVVAAYNNAINTAKQKENLTVAKARTLDLELGNTAPSLAKGAVKSALNKAVQPMDDTVTLEKDGKQTAVDLLSPVGRYANLKLSGVSAAKAKQTDNGYTITIKLKDEKAVSKPDKSRKAKMHNASLGALEPGALKAFGLKAQTGKIQYSGAVIRLTIDSKGRLTSYKFTQPFTGKLSGKYLFFKLNSAFEGTVTETVSLTYSK